MGALEALRRDFPGVHSLLVYIREAHASDEWLMEQNTQAGVCLPQPRTLAERRAAALALIEHLGLEMTVAVDGLDDTVAETYGAWPERIYVIDARGRVAYQGGPGPMEFDPEAARTFLGQHLGEERAPR